MPSVYPYPPPEYPEDTPTSSMYLPNIFGEHLAPLTQRDEAELKALRNSPTLRKVLNNTLCQEYRSFLSRSPLKQTPQELHVAHAYLAGMYALAASLIEVN
jgi:hypothetical protein